MIYDVIDNSNGFYKGHAEKDSRSLMNITFNLATPEMEKDFVAKGKAAGFVGIGGHRLVGGCRASTYNAVPMEACIALAEFILTPITAKPTIIRHNEKYTEFIINFAAWKKRQPLTSIQSTPITNCSVCQLFIP